MPARRCGRVVGCFRCAPAAPRSSSLAHSARQAASCLRGTRGTRRRRSRCRRCRPRRRTSRWRRACRRRRRSRTPSCARSPAPACACLRRTDRTRTRRPGRSRRSCRRSAIMRGEALGRVRADVEDHLVRRRRRRRALTSASAFGGELRRDDDVGRQRNVDARSRAERRSRSLRDVDHLRLDQRLADAVALRGEEGVGDAAADDQLVDLAEQALEHRELGRHLRAGDDRDQRTRRASRAPSPARSARSSAAGRRRRPCAKRATPCVLASARCAVPNASITKTSHSAAMLASPDLPRPSSRPC